MLFNVLVLIATGLGIGLLVGLFAAQRIGERVEDVRTESFKLGRKCGRSGISGYRLIADPTIRAYVKSTTLAGCSVSELISHIQHAGLKDFVGKATEYAVKNRLTAYLTIDTVVDTIMNLVDVVEKPVVIDGITFNPWEDSSPLRQEVFQVLYF